MAVQDKYIDTEAAADRLASRTGSNGGAVKGFSNDFETVAADSNNSVYRIVKGISPTDVLQELKIYADTITSGTDFRVGITYSKSELTTGSVPMLVDLSGALDLSSGAALSSPKDGLASVDIDQIDKNIAELIVAEDYAVESWSNPEAWRPIDLVIKGVVIGSAGGTIAYRGQTISGD